MVISVGADAPPVPGADTPGAHVLVFYKVTCGVTQMATPAIERLAKAYPGRVVGVGQDPGEALDAFAFEYGLSFPQVADLDPYDASNAYGIASAPTAVLVDGAGVVADVAESWDRDAWNRLSAGIARLVSVPPVTVSEPEDGLPEFKPG